MLIIAEMISIVGFNLFILLSGFFPIVQYQNQTYTILNFPNNTWYGIVYKIVFIAVIFALRSAIEQTSSLMNYDAKQSLSLSVLALVAFVVTTIAVESIQYNNMFILLVILLGTATYFQLWTSLSLKESTYTMEAIFKKAAMELEKKYRKPPKVQEPQEEPQTIEKEPKEEPTPEQKEKVYKALTMSAEYMAKTIKIMDNIKSNYRIMSIMTLATVLIYNLPIVNYNNQTVPLVALSDTYVRIVIKMIFLALLLSYASLFNIKGNRLLVINILFVAATFIYMLYVLVNVFIYYNVTWLFLLLVIFIAKSIYNLINE